MKYDPETCCLCSYVNHQIFGHSADSLTKYVDRMSALTDNEQYAILYLITRNSFLSRTDLKHLTQLPTETLNTHLRTLSDAGFITEKPVSQPDNEMIVRATETGQKEVTRAIRGARGAGYY